MEQFMNLKTYDGTKRLIYKIIKSLNKEKGKLKYRAMFFAPGYEIYKHTWLLRKEAIVRIFSGLNQIELLQPISESTLKEIKEHLSKQVGNWTIYKEY